jgi:hypothetical protein
LSPEGGRKDLVMKTQRRFRPEFKRQVIEELLSGISSPARLFVVMKYPPAFSITGNSSTPKEPLRIPRIKPPL